MSKSKAPAQQSERRKYKRRQILDSFSMFVSVPKKGGHKLELHDLSEQGIGFDYDTEGEAHADSPVAKGDVMEVQVYMNQSLCIPLQVRIARVEPGGIRKVGAEFKDTGSPAFQAIQAFVQFLDKLEAL